MVLEVEGHRRGSVELDSSHLIKGFASASVQIVQKLLTAEEIAEEIADSQEADADDHVSESLQSEALEESQTAATKEVLRPVVHDGSSGWDKIQVPPYVKQVSFHVSPQDLTPERADDLRLGFQMSPFLLDQRRSTMLRLIHQSQCRRRRRISLNPSWQSLALTTTKPLEMP